MMIFSPLPHRLLLSLMLIFTFAQDGSKPETLPDWVYFVRSFWWQNSELCAPSVSNCWYAVLCENNIEGYKTTHIGAQYQKDGTTFYSREAPSCDIVWIKWMPRVFITMVMK